MPPPTLKPGPAFLKATSKLMAKSTLQRPAAADASPSPASLKKYRDADMDEDMEEGEEESAVESSESE
eukprot:678326-Heterocapsa_arctica.AAC.1